MEHKNSVLLINDFYLFEVGHKLNNNHTKKCHVDDPYLISQ